MPYIKSERRAALDVIIDGLVKKLRERIHIKKLNDVFEQPGTVWLSYVIRFIPCAVLIDTEPYLPAPDIASGLTTDLVCRLKDIEAVKGDVNYALTRIVLESMKPEDGWDYHSLSDAVSILRAAADWVNREYGASRVIRPAMSVLRDAADEISRRLLVPYEDVAILKNGDIPCFDESFAFRPSGAVGQFTVSSLPYVSPFLKHPIPNKPIDVEFKEVVEGTDMRGKFESGLTNEQWKAAEEAVKERHKDESV